MCDAAAFDGVALSPGVIDRLGTGGVRVKQCRWRYGDAVRIPFPPHKALAGKFTTVSGHAGSGFDGFSGYTPGDHKGCLCSLVPVFCAAPGARGLTAAAVDDVDECGPPTVANMTPEFTLDEVRQMVEFGHLSTGVGSTGDEMLAFLMKRNGFDALPTVLDDASYLQYLRDNPGAIDAWRGVKETTQARAFLEGRYWAGQGVYGNGTYVAYGEGAELVAAEYAALGEGSNILRMTLAADAKVVPFDTMKEVTRLYRDRLWQRANIAQLKDELALEVDDADDFFGRRIRKREADIAEIDSQLSAKIGADWHDPIPDGLTPDDYFVLAQKFDEYGRVAALLDIDAISVGFHEQAVILNRAKVVASDRLRSAEEL